MNLELMSRNIWPGKVKTSVDTLRTNLKLLQGVDFWLVSGGFGYLGI